MSNVIREIWLLGRNRAALAALVLLAVFAAAGVAIGLANVARDSAMIERMLAGQPAEDAAVAGFVTDAGYGAYYGFPAGLGSPIGSRFCRAWQPRYRACDPAGPLAVAGGAAL
ncbi:hypothetical protein [Blastomonas sp.]|uniref:hypothetical protein n=1 Tax=Blastomonas sp. TaxID=1909299 RepID=UPI0026027A5B|nr:hypothetical protein [Blastomonas sp.]MDM7956623.1 hypothetical protein [Blastomonas sp.]